MIIDLPLLFGPTNTVSGAILIMADLIGPTFAINTSTGLTNPCAGQATARLRDHLTELPTCVDRRAARPLPAMIFGAYPLGHGSSQSVARVDPGALLPLGGCGGDRWRGLGGPPIS